MIRRYFIAAVLAVIASTSAFGFELGLGNSFGRLGSLSGNFGCASSNSACDSAAVAIFNATTVPPTPADRVRINNAVVSLKAAGIWSLLDVLYDCEQATQQGANLNWINPATFTAVPTSSPTFIPYVGCKGDGTASYSAIPYNLSTNGTNFTLSNGASFFVKSEENVRADKALIGVSGTPGTYISPWNLSLNSSSTGLNNAGVNTAVPNSGQGLFLLNRASASTIYTVDQNGVQLASITASPTALPNFTFRINGSNGASPQFDSADVSWYGVGGFMTPTQRASLYTILNTYHTSLGTVVQNFNPSVNWNTAAGLNALEIAHYDTSGNMLDAHAGNILYVNGTYWLYGEAHQCGSVIGTSGTPYCGVRVYACSSLDFKSCVDNGYLFDPSGFQSACAPIANTFIECYSPKMLYNKANNNYVLWLYNQGASVGKELVFTCTTPNGGATPSTPGTGCTQQSNVTFCTNCEAPAFYVEPGGNAYAAYTDLGNSSLISVVQLNSAYTNTTGSPTSTGVDGEGLGLFEANGQTYLLYGAIGCGYCANTTTSYVSASTPLGTYGSATTLNSSNSCEGQPRDVIPVTAGGITNYVFLVDQWWGPSGAPTGTRANQGLAGIYAVPLFFNASNAILPYNCNPSVLITGLTPSATPATPLANSDQSSVGPDIYTSTCDMSSTNWYAQAFVPTKSVVNNIAVQVGVNNSACVVGTSCSTPTPNGTLTVSLMPTSGGLPTGSPIASATLAASSMSWAAKFTTVSMGGVAVTPGTTYAIELSTTTTNGCMGVTMSALGGVAPYTLGGLSNSTNSGGSWSLQTGRTALFAEN